MLLTWGRRGVRPAARVLSSKAISSCQPRSFITTRNVLPLLPQTPRCTHSKARASTTIFSSSPFSTETVASTPDVPAQSSSQAARTVESALDEVKSLQEMEGETDSRWLKRVGRNSNLEGKFKVVVIGERHTPTNALVTALVENPLLDPFSNEAEADVNRPRLISYGTESISRSSGSPADPTGPVEVKSPAEWLLRHGVEIYSLPDIDTTNLDKVDDYIHRADLIILVTDIHRRLTSAKESALLKDLFGQGMKNVVVVVEGLVATSDKQVEVLDEIRERIRQVGGPTAAPSVVPVSVHRARAAQKLLRDKQSPASFAAEWSSSGLQNLKTSILSRLDTANVRERHKVQAAAFTGSLALARIADAQEAAKSSLLRARDDIQTLRQRVKESEQRLTDDFQKKDLDAVQSSVSQLSEAVNQYFDKVKFWKLFWRSDFVSSDLRQKMREHSLGKADYQMVYSIGKLNEGLFNIFERVREQITPLADPSQSQLNDASMLASSLRHDVARVQQVLAQHTPPAPGTEVHPFFLRNEIAKFDETRQCDELQQQANKLVRRQLVYQVVVYPTGLLAFHLGVPAAIVFPFALLASAGGLGFMRLRWGVARSRFWGQVDAGYKSLRSKLLFAYTEELKRVGTTPVTAIIQMLEDTIDARLKDLARNEKERQRLQAILRQLQQ